MGIKIETNVEFGKEYEDSNTGLKGKAVSVSKWEFGCIRIALQPKAKEDGTVPDILWLDEQSLIDRETGKRIEPVIEKPKGGPTSTNPKNYSNPK